MRSGNEKVRTVEKAVHPRGPRLALLVAAMLLAAAGVLVAGGWLKGSGQEGGGDQGLAGSRMQQEGRLSFEADIEPLLAKRCGSCHTMEDPKGKLVLDPGQGYGQMVDRSSSQVAELQLVKPGDPESSYLVQKLEHTSGVGKGMPRTLFGARKLPEKELQLFRRWIEQGAAP